ncbi:formin-like protein 3 [Andrographis paniculata]|uniref:formin-like protein 3 n=1 Tax=Andrographis paniculata TaxID=175694 RepID=UPI0021E78AD3|nr:formin-like protein 3 [Andrographis paniculata]
MRIREKKSTGVSYLLLLIMVVVGVESNREESETFLTYLIDSGVIDPEMAELFRAKCSNELLHAMETLQNLKSSSRKERLGAADVKHSNGRPSTTKMKDDVHLWCPRVKQILLDCSVEKNLMPPYMMEEKDMNNWCARYSGALVPRRCSSSHRALAQSSTEITVQTAPKNMIVIVVAPVTFIVAVMLWCCRSCGLGLPGTGNEEGPLLTVSLSSNSGAYSQKSGRVGSSKSEDKLDIPLRITAGEANSSAEEFVHVPPAIGPAPGIPPLKPPPGRKIPPSEPALMLPSPPPIPSAPPPPLVLLAPPRPLLTPPSPPLHVPPAPPAPPAPAPLAPPVPSSPRPPPIPSAAAPLPPMPPIRPPVRPVAPCPPPPGPPPPGPPPPPPMRSAGPAPPPPPPMHAAGPRPPPPPPGPSRGPGIPPPGPPPPPKSSSVKVGPLPPPPPGGGNPSRTQSIGVKLPVPPGGSPFPYGTSKAKLKPFFWDKVAANANGSMVWHAIKCGSFQFDEEMMESLFGYTPPGKNGNAPKKETTSQAPPKFIQLVDPKKSQNLSIILKALSVTAEEVCDAIEEGNELPPELIQTLVKMAPTADEELKLRLYDGDLTKLNLGDRFLKLLIEIPFAFKRLESLLFMCTLQEDSTMLREGFMVLEAACTELRKSRLFLKLLEAVLKTGNRMNDGTFRGGAQAFKLDTLLKLSDVKAVDGKLTLLHFVVLEIIRTEGIRASRASREMRRVSSIESEDLLDDPVQDSDENLKDIGLQVVSSLSTDLKNVKKAAILDVDAISGTVAKIGHLIIKAKEFLSSEMKSIEEDNGFHQALKHFVQNAEGDIAWLLEEEKRIMALIKSTADYFHGKSGKDEGFRLFTVVRDFLLCLDKVCLEVKSAPLKPIGKSAKKEETTSQDSSSKTSPAPPDPSPKAKTAPPPPSAKTGPADPGRPPPPPPPPGLPRTDPVQRVSAAAIAMRRMDNSSSSSSSDDDL